MSIYKTEAILNGFIDLQSSVWFTLSSEDLDGKSHPGNDGGIGQAFRANNESKNQPSTE